MNTRLFTILTVLTGCMVCSSTNAQIIDLGRVTVDFDSASFVNFGNGFIVGADTITFYPAARVDVPDTGGTLSLDFSARFAFSAKAGYSITGYTLKASGVRNSPEYTSTSLDGHYAAGTSEGSFTGGEWATDWSDAAELNGHSEVRVYGTLSAVSTPYTWSSWEQTGVEWGVVGYHDEPYSVYEYVRDEPEIEPRPYWTTIGSDEDGDPVFGWACCQDTVVGYRQVYDWVQYIRQVEDYGNVPIYGEVWHSLGNPASLSLDALTLTTHVVPIPSALQLMSLGIGAIAWTLRPRQKPNHNA